MADTFTEVLLASKTNPNRAMKWTPVCRGVGTLELTDSRAHVRYAVCDLPTPAGRAFRLTKADRENCTVTVVAGRGECECKGFVFGRGKACKHLEAVRAMEANGWM